MKPSVMSRLAVELILLGLAGGAHAAGDRPAPTPPQSVASGDRPAAVAPQTASPGEELAATASQAAAAAWQPVEGRELLGTSAPEWTGIEWVQGGPLRLADLRGKVVLLRFWLTGCPYCVRSAPALNELWQRYGERGLVVVGLHHPKSMLTHLASTVSNAARKLEFNFPVGMDNDWKTIRSYGVGTKLKRFTSVSFLIDQAGVIRFVHDGGEFHLSDSPDHQECQAAYEALRAKIEELLQAP